MKAPRVDLAVLGDGVVGLACALAAAEAGHTVTVVTGAATGDLGGGAATLAAGAMLTVFSESVAADSPERIDTEVRERLAARAIYDRWLKQLNADAADPVTLTPGVWVLAGPDGTDDSADLEAIAAGARRAGHIAEHHHPRDVPGLHPARGHRPHAALWLPHEASLDTGTLMAALAGAVKAHEQISWTFGPAARIGQDSDGVMTIGLGNGPTIQADRVLLAAGAGISPLLAASGLAETAGLPPVLAGRGASLVLSTPLRFPNAVRTVNRGFACGTHAVPRHDGQLYIGGTNRLSTEPSAHRASADEISTLIHSATTELHSGLRHAEVAAMHLGHRPYTLDHLPLIGPSHDPRILVATATYRTGVLLAPHLARLLVCELDTPGSLAAHPYAATRPMPVPALADLLGDAAAAGLVDMLCQPGGQLPPGVEDGLGHFLLAGLAAVAGSTPPITAAMARRLFERAPVAEAIPLLFDTTGRSTR